MTFEEWSALSLAARDDLNDNGAANALCSWFESQRLSQGEGLSVMALVIGRMVAAKLHADMPTGVIAAQAALDLVTLNIQEELRRLSQ